MVQTEMCKADDYDQTIISWRSSLPLPSTRCTYGIVRWRSVYSLCRPLPRAGSGPFIGGLRWRQEQQSSRSLFYSAVTAEHRALFDRRTASRCFSITRNADRIPIGRDRGIMSIAANAFKRHAHPRIACDVQQRGQNQGNVVVNLALIFKVDWILFWNHID